MPKRTNMVCLQYVCLGLRKLRASLNMTKWPNQSWVMFWYSRFQTCFVFINQTQCSHIHFLQKDKKVQYVWLYLRIMLTFMFIQFSTMLYAQTYVWFSFIFCISTIEKTDAAAGDIGCFLVLASFFAMVFVEVGGCEPGNAGDLLDPQMLVLD